LGKFKLGSVCRLQEQDVWVRQQIAVSQAGGSSGGHVSGPNNNNEHAQSSQDQSGDVSVLQAVELTLAQFDGLVEGYAARAAHEASLCAAAGAACTSPLLRPMEREHHVFMQNNGELYDIVDGWLAGQWGDAAAHHQAVAAGDSGESSMIRNRGWKATANGGAILRLQQQQQNRRSSQAVPSVAHSRPWAAAKAALQGGAADPLTPEQWMRLVSISERCSSLIKVSGDLSDLFLGHATWDSFTNVRRVPRSWLHDTDLCS
jgi:hypothetical protein